MGQGGWVMAASCCLAPARVALFVPLAGMMYCLLALQGLTHKSVPPIHCWQGWQCGWLAAAAPAR